MSPSLGIKYTATDFNELTRAKEPAIALLESLSRTARN